MSECVLYSDGGARRGVSGAGGCIVESDRGERLHIAAFLGEATNNEAEIFAGLLGFATLQAAGQAGGSVRWVCDSEYVLKSATGYIVNWQRNGWQTASKAPVKNQALWRSYLVLSDGFSITPEHVRGHTGHPENEACDVASTWLQENYSPGMPLQCEIDGLPWFVLDGAEALAAIRNGDQSTGYAHLVAELVASAGINGFGDAVAVEPDRTDYASVVEYLQRAKGAADSLASGSARAGALSAQIEKLIRQYKK